MIRFRNVYFTHQHMDQEFPLFENLSFSIPKGEWVALIGPNGSGKSTLMQLMVGLRRPDKGVISVCGFNPADQEACWQVRKRIGVVFQHPENQLIGATVMDDVAFGLENLGFPSEQMEQVIETGLKQVGLYERRYDLPQHLSGGQMQRLAIASALAVSAEILIFDEATSMLDPEGKTQIWQLLNHLHQQGMTIMTITHDMDEAWAADRILLLSQGRLVADGPPQGVLTQTDLLLKHGLEPPFIVRMKQALEQQGLPLSSSIYTREELVGELCRLLRED